MADAHVYRDPEEDISQGDIFDGVPHLRLRHPLYVLRRYTAKGGREQWARYPFPGNAPPATVGGGFHVKEGEDVSAWCQVTRGIVLNYDCDLVNQQDHCLVALLRPVGNMRPDDLQIIRENRNFNYFHLPADPSRRLEEAYVDFRRMTCLDFPFMEGGTRLAALSPQMVSDLQNQLLRFFSRRELPDRT